MATARSPLSLQLLPGKQPDVGKLPRGGFVSLVIHTAVIAGTIYGTASARHTTPVAALGTTAVVIAPAEPQHEPASLPAVIVPLKDFQTVTAPAVIVIAIPVNLQERFDPKDFTGVGVDSGAATGVVPAPDQVYDPSVLDDPPILLLSPPLDYPPLLRQAGLTCRVVVEAVIDTTGRAETASVRVIQGAQSAFDQPSRQWMLDALFRPARAGGRHVRVRINRALDYAISRSP